MLFQKGFYPIVVDLSWQLSFKRFFWGSGFFCNINLCTLVSIKLWNFNPECTKLICSRLLKNRVWKIKFDGLDFFFYLKLEKSSSSNSILQQSSANNGQLISKCPYEKSVSSKIPTKIFLDLCPEIFCSFLGASW